MGSVEIYCGLAFVYCCILRLSSTLIVYLDCIQVVLYVLFITEKNQKVPSPAKSVTTAFCSRVASDILRLAVVFRKQLFVQASGTKQLAFHAITATHICTAQTNFVLFPMLDRLLAVILMVPVLFLDYHCTRKTRGVFHCKGNSPPTAERHR